MLTFDVIIPVYNRLIEDVPIIKYFKDKNNLNFYVCDNSTENAIKEANRRHSLKYSQMEYVDMRGNAGLSRAFNAAIPRGNSEIITIFDDDTEPLCDFFSAASVEILKHGEGVYVPIVGLGDEIISPLTSLGPAIVRVKDLARIKDERIYAFNTGICITRSIVRQGLCWDEGQFVDFVDHAFFRKVHELHIPIYIMKSIKLLQEYSMYSDDFDAALRRYCTKVRDLRNFYQEEGYLGRAYARAYIMYLAFRNTIRYKSVLFIWRGLKACLIGCADNG